MAKAVSSAAEPPTTPQQQDGVAIEGNAMVTRCATPQDSDHLNRAEPQQFPRHRAEQPQALARELAVSSATATTIDQTIQDSASPHRAEQQQCLLHRAEQPEQPQASLRTDAVSSAAEMPNTPQQQSGVEKPALKSHRNPAQDSSSQPRAEPQQFPLHRADRPLASSAATLAKPEAAPDVHAHADPVLAVGALVRLHVLRAKPEHNGLLGE
jgi:hypothetical protein